MSVRVLHRVKHTLSPFTPNHMVNFHDWTKLVVGNGIWLALGGLITGSAMVAVLCGAVWLIMKYVWSGGVPQWTKHTIPQLPHNNKWTVFGLMFLLGTLLIPASIVLMAIIGGLLLLANFD